MATESRRASRGFSKGSEVIERRSECSWDGEQWCSCHSGNTHAHMFYPLIQWVRVKRTDMGVGRVRGGQTNYGYEHRERMSVVVSTQRHRYSHYICQCL